MKNSVTLEKKIIPSTTPLVVCWFVKEKLPSAQKDVMPIPCGPELNYYYALLEMCAIAVHTKTPIIFMHGPFLTSEQKANLRLLADNVPNLFIVDTDRFLLKFVNNPSRLEGEKELISESFRKFRSGNPDKNNIKPPRGSVGDFFETFKLYIAHYQDYLVQVLLDDPEYKKSKIKQEFLSAIPRDRSQMSIRQIDFDVYSKTNTLQDLETSTGMVAVLNLGDTRVMSRKKIIINYSSLDPVIMGQLLDFIDYSIGPMQPI